MFKYYTGIKQIKDVTWAEVKNLGLKVHYNNNNTPVCGALNQAGVRLLTNSKFEVSCKSCQKRISEGNTGEYD